MAISRIIAAAVRVAGVEAAKAAEVAGQGRVVTPRNPAGRTANGHMGRVDAALFPQPLPYKERGSQRHSTAEGVL